MPNPSRTLNTPFNIPAKVIESIDELFSLFGCKVTDVTEGLLKVLHPSGTLISVSKLVFNTQVQCGKVSATFEEAQSTRIEKRSKTGSALLSVEEVPSHIESDSKQGSFKHEGKITCLSPSILGIPTELHFLRILILSSGSVRPMEHQTILDFE